MLWLALDSETKLIISYHIGRRSGINAHAFISDLRARTNGRYQLTSDQYNAYVGATREHFGQNVDFAQLRKIYSSGTGDGWYGSGQVVAAVPHVKIGRPDFKRISTSHVERNNLSRSDAPSQIYAPDQCLQQDAGKPQGCRRALHGFLQLLPRSYDAQANARYGCGDN